MCCFSKPVISVSATNIFARVGEGDRQFLVYSMSINAKADLAMIPPLPVKEDSGEKAVEFIDFKEYSDFFAFLVLGFSHPPLLDNTFMLGGHGETAPPPLEVIEVGDFEASFVPTIEDFARLDGRFRLPPETWSKLPEYKSFGFAVFKLKAGTKRIHPMAFSFPRRDPKALFFPTVHIHDGKVHATADFDHILYCQPKADHWLEVADWRESRTVAMNFVRVNRTKGVVLPEQHCYQLELHGQLPNRDKLVAVQG